MRDDDPAFPIGLLIFALVCLVIASVYIRANTESPAEPETIRCTEPEEVVLLDGAPLCPTKRQQRVLHLRSLYRAHRGEVACA